MAWSFVFGVQLFEVRSSCKFCWYWVLMVGSMVFNTTFNNISVISWQSVLLVEETTDLPQVTDKLYHIMLYWVYLAWARFKLTTLVVIGIDCTGSCISNYHTSATITAPFRTWWVYTNMERERDQPRHNIYIFKSQVNCCNHLDNSESI